MSKSKNVNVYPSYHKYVEYFKIGFKKSIEYKSYLIGTLTTPFFMGVFFYFIWQYIFEVKGGGDPLFLIGGFTFNEMIVYLVIGLLINTARASDISDRISQMIKSGDIAIMLCRPVNFVKSLLADSFGSRVINISMFFVLLLVITKVAGIPYPPVSIFAVFLVYGLLLIFFDIVINVMIGGLAFWLTEIWGVRSSIQQVLWILSGRALPLSLFPTWMIGFLRWTPFFYLEFTFASIYLGKLGLYEAVRAMGIFTVWIVIMVVLMRALYNRGFSKLTSFGG